VNWSKGIRATWKPGEEGASERLDSFIEEELYAYQEGRDRPDLEGTSRLSPHLHFGEVSPRQVWHAVQAASITAPMDGTIAGSEGFLRQLYWREFAYHLLFHEPQTTDHPLREEFAAFPWSTDDVSLRAWQEGRTGFPYIDAGMRQLWGTGWMHNRVRMAVASFLVKDLLIPWQEGAKWFWDTLVDADLANNTMGWQWAAGCGADAAPYFRIFNPITQGERFDPKGVYVRRWVPELAGLPDKYVHRPWEAPGDVLAQAGVSLGQDYPRPIVDHAEARALALGAYETIRRKQ
jgi:deoxyribodipyrimidine photo-lyase